MSVEVLNLSYKYASGTAYETDALDNVSLKIHDGEFVGVMGRTGSGKSTLIQLISGLIKPESGTVLFNGEDINAKKYDKRELRKKVGIVFQHPEYQLFESTVEKDVAFGLKHFGLSSQEVHERVKNAIETVGFSFDKIADQSPFGLSGGEKRMVAIAGVIAMHSELLILDEPVAGLDPYNRENFLSLIETLNKNGTTVIAVSHNTDALAEYARRIVVLENGKIAADGKTNEILSDRDLTQKLNIGTSGAFEIAEMLRKRGMDIPEQTVKFSELTDGICSQFGGNDQ